MELKQLVLIGCLCILTLTLHAPPPSLAANNSNDSIIETSILERLGKPAFGDLDDMRKRRTVRVLVSYSRSNYFNELGQEKGLEFELLTLFGQYLNSNAKRAYDKIHMVFVPKPFDELLSSLNRGEGDIVAAGMTITPERKALVDFSKPYIPNVREVVVSGKAYERFDSIEKLTGKTLYVRAGASYIDHLESINKGFVQKGLEPMNVKAVEENVSTEDILEMVNAGIIHLTVADEHIARLWSEALPDIRIHPEIAVHTGGDIAWAVRKGSPQLLESLNGFVDKNKKGTLIGNVLFKRYFGQSKWIKNPASEEERGKLKMLKDLFERYGRKYNFDWLALAAQGFQESRLDHSTRSPAGAVGIMQLLPSTAKGAPVFIPNIEEIEANIHAGAKYLSHLRETYFNDPGMSAAARMDFSWAAYNAGPTRISRLRDVAEQRGFDRNSWFYHVEQVVAEKIGRETVDYVANINKYYFAYRLLYEEMKRSSMVRPQRP